MFFGGVFFCCISKLSQSFVSHVPTFLEHAAGIKLKMSEYVQKNNVLNKVPTSLELGLTQFKYKKMICKSFSTYISIEYTTNTIYLMFKLIFANIH